MPEIRVSPDRKSVAIRGTNPDPDAENAWAVMHCMNGGHWCSTIQLVGDWITLDVPEPTPQPTEE